MSEYFTSLVSPAVTWFAFSGLDGVVRTDNAQVTLSTRVSERNVADAFGNTVAQWSEGEVGTSIDSFARPGFYEAQVTVTNVYAGGVLKPVTGWAGKVFLINRSQSRFGAG